MKVAEAQRGEGFLLVVCLCCVVLLLRFPRLSGADVVLAALALDWCSGMVSDGFQTQRRGSWILAKERAEQRWRIGFVNSVLNQMCERSGVAGDATTTSSRAAGKGQAGSRGENWRLVHVLFIVEWRRRQEVQKSGGRD